MRGAAVGVVALSLATACSHTPQSSTTSVAVNACPGRPCSAYVDGGVAPACNNEGACVVDARLTNAVLFVSMPSDSLFAPDRTIAVPWPPPSMPCATSPICTVLPDVGLVRAAYSVPLQLQDDILHYVLNTNTSNPTTLPVHVSYRPLWPLSSSAGGDAIAAGLPLVSVEMDSITNQVYRDSNYSGPAGGPSQMFATYLQPGYYLRTIAPQAPFDATFPPDVGVVGVIATSPFEDDAMTLDATSVETTDHPVIPTFSLTFGGSGTFDGWSAFLRDQTTKQTLSNVVALSGTTVNNLVLPTNHHPPDGDALTGAELFLQPPAGQPLPAGVFAPQGGMLTANLTYQALPPPIPVTGTVSAPNGRPVEADIVFEAIGIAEATAPRRPVGSPCLLNTANFEYATQASARIDATGASTWAAVLPVGQYRVSIRPLDPIASPPAAPVAVAAFGVTMVSPFSVGPIAEACAPPSNAALVVSATQLVAGVAIVADGRPLSGAEVDAIPVQCSDGSAAAACLPKPRQVGTGDDGSFGLLLDPGGSYLLRARPADGTRLPWTFLPKPLLVAPGSTMTPRIVVPVPLSAGLTLLDPSTNAIPDAVVRMCELDPSGRWLEVGHAVTDSSGHYEMYLAPPAQ
jgi:hypothetical protein